MRTNDDWTSGARSSFPRAVRHDVPADTWVALARTVHEIHPFTRIATFGETGQDRGAVIGEALGIATHSPRTVELAHDKHAMRSDFAKLVSTQRLPR